MFATEKQVAFARKLFDRSVKTGAKHGAPSKFTRWEDEMSWLDLNPESRRDVSEYLDMHASARRDAVMYLKGR